MRTFHLIRAHKVPGASATGIVAEGIEFSDRTCAIRWLAVQAGTAIFTTVEELMRVVDRDGEIRVVWLVPAIGYGA